MVGVLISLISCSREKEKVLGVNVQSSKSFTGDMTVKTLNINLADGEMCLPKYIEGDKIYGLKTLSPSLGSKIGTASDYLTKN